MRYSSVVHDRVFHHAFGKMQGSWNYLLARWQNLEKRRGLYSCTGVEEPPNESISYLVCWEDEPITIVLSAS